MSSTTRHPEDGVLLRLLDGEWVETEAHDHVASCPECRRRMDTLSRRSERLGDVLRSGDALIEVPAWSPDFLSTLVEASPARQDALDPEGSGTAGEGDASAARETGAQDGAPGGKVEARPRRGRPLRVSVLRWAAAVALLTVLVSVSPVRAWVVGGARAIWGWIADSADRQSPPGPADAGPGSTEVATSISGSVLMLRLSGPDSPDSLVVRATGEDRARAVLRPGGGDGELVVRADGFEVRSSPRGGTVEVWAPPGVVEIRVTRGEVELARRSRGEDPDWSWRLAIPGTDPHPGV